MVKRFDGEYEETLTLRSGREVRLRCVRPEDRALLKQGFDALSDQSKFLRFFAGKQHLSEAELTYLTEVDGENHVAIGAQDIATGEPLGVARCVRLPDEPDVAEAAVAVVDAAQGEGLGSALLERIAEAARERGVVFFRVEVLSGNEPMRHLLKEISPEIRFENRPDGVLEALMALPDTEVRASSLQRVLSFVAQEVVRVAFGRWLLKGWLAEEGAATTAIDEGADEDV